MRKYLVPFLLIGFWGCEENNDETGVEPLFITMDIENVECIEIGQFDYVRCDYLQLTIPFNSNNVTPSISYSEGNEPYLWSALPFTDCIEDPESDGVYDEGDGCWNIDFTFTYTNDSVILKWENEDIDLDWDTYSYIGLNNNFWNSIYKIES